MLLASLAVGATLLAGVVAGPAAHAFAATPSDGVVHPAAWPDPVNTQFLELIQAPKSPSVGSVLLQSGRWRKCVDMEQDGSLVTVRTGSYRSTSFFGTGCRSGYAYPRSVGNLPATGRWTEFYVSAVAGPDPLRL
ncbi:hypothetical protein [Clavibacter sp. VKM Ac-2872]|uniref:hypothetical protein n=1 Tax=Clavibacter sp. VKM Ac-2872 TaxID=2783812 RepID=UPI00188B4349|nr:hypothetical protein [Clavibacter sp. VKM Ac-2872]MBF4622796.1 hypothetical protein [Clavibacter sp. VKM Ac-2872]